MLYLKRCLHYYVQAYVIPSKKRKLGEGDHFPADLVGTYKHYENQRGKPM